MTTQARARGAFAYRHRQAILLAVALSGITAVWAVVMPAQHVDAASSPSAPPAGRMWASNCFQCHGTDGQSGAFDQLAGDSAGDLFNKLKDQQRKNTIMGSHARGYTDAELRAIAAYFASVPKK
jgi:cytochrome c553